MEAMQDILQSVGVQMGDVAKGDTVLGAPIQLGSVTVYPVSRITLGVGVGGGTGDEAPSNTKSGETRAAGTGVGVGGAIKARPVAVIVFSEDGVSVIPIADKKCRLDAILDKLPELFDKFKDGQPKKCGC